MSVSFLFSHTSYILLVSSIVKNLLASYLLHLRKKFHGTPRLTLNSNKIDFVESVKYLGVHICNSLTDDDDIANRYAISLLLCDLIVVMPIC